MNGKSLLLVTYSTVSFGIFLNPGTSGETKRKIAIRKKIKEMVRVKKIEKLP
jgi:hypothetical protein